jgi:hypothetical protein
VGAGRLISPRRQRRRFSGRRTAGPALPGTRNEALFAAFGEEVTALTHKLLAAGIQTREGERHHERIANSI